MSGFFTIGLIDFMFKDKSVTDFKTFFNQTTLKIMKK